MNFLGGLFGTTKNIESAVLVDVGAESVAGAYVYSAEGETPAILYTSRLPVEAREGETAEVAMLRALKLLGDTLIREGAPALARATGSAHARAVILSISAPWQKISVRTEHLEKEAPFVFTRSIVSEMLEKTDTKADGKLLVDESVIGTILNGYETHDPYGKEVRRASVIVLTSLIDERVAEDVAATLRGIYHTKDISPIAGGSLHCQAVRRAFPHERDALILDATGPTISIALVRRGLFVAVEEVPGADTVDAWMKHIRATLAELGKRYPLPRTIFLLAGEAEEASLREKLGAASLGELWLSDNPPKVVSVLAEHIVPLVRQVTTASPDLSLLLMALYWRSSLEEAE